MKWKSREDNPELEVEIEKKYNYSSAFIRLLSRRFSSIEEVERELNLEEHDPYLFRDIEKAVNRIQEAKTVFVFTDFDTDGVGSNVILTMALREMGKTVVGITGARSLGYGFHRVHVDQAKKEGCDLIITADVGIKANESIKYANSIGIDTIVTDHHLPGDLPEAFAILDPWVEGETYPFKDLAGVGVAFKLIQGLLPGMTKGYREQLLEFVTVSTITDVAKIIGENRLWVREGLRLLKNPKNLGIQMVFKHMKFQDRVMKRGYVIPSDIQFGIGPLINSCSRMKDNGMQARALFLTTDGDLANTLASDLKRTNDNRQKIMNGMVNHCKRQPRINDKMIVIAHETFDDSLCGVVGSKLTDEFGKPSFIICTEKGSARSVPDIHIYDFLKKMDSSIFKSLGGHSAACGFRLNVTADEFRTAVLELAEPMDEDLFGKYRLVDCELNMDELTEELLEDIKMLEPYGHGNPMPEFVSYGQLPYPTRIVGRDKNHLSLFLQDPTGKRKGIFWDGANRLSLSEGEEHHPESIAVVYRVQLNEYNGYRNCQMVIQDLEEIA